MSNAQKSWAESTEHGFRELSCGRYADAARRWLEADVALPARVMAFDPLRAASRSNAGAARLLLGHAHEAAACFDEAEQSWQDVIAGIAKLNVPITGASSSFHFRLAAAAPDSLVEARRTRYRRLAEAALAMSHFNRAFIAQRNVSFAAISKRACALQPIVSDVLGAASPEARLLSSCDEPCPPSGVFAIYAEKLSEITSRPQTFAAVLSDECAKVECAVARTALLAPPVFMSLRPGAAEFENHNATCPSFNPSFNDV